MIPLKYNIRSMSVRWVTTLLTILAIAIVVFTSVLSLGMVAGIYNALDSSGDPEDVIVMRKGSSDELSSNIDTAMARDLINLAGIDKDENGDPLVSREFVTIMTCDRRGGEETANVLIRGLEKAGRKLRPNFTIVEGRELEPGTNELIASVKMAGRYENFGLGEETEINKVKFKVVGLFEAGGSAAESEVWADFRDLTSAQRFEGAVSVVNMRVKDEQSRTELMKRIKDDDQFKLKAISEQEYFESQKGAAGPLIALAIMIASFLLVGATFAAANTMYAAVSSRGREIGTLRALGFSRMNILVSFMLESIIICLVGGLLGCLATIPLNGLSGATQGSNFSELSFAASFGPVVLGMGMCLALFMGTFGGLLPAIKAIRIRIVNALRQR